MPSALGASKNDGGNSAMAPLMSATLASGDGSVARPTSGSRAMPAERSRPDRAPGAERQIGGRLLPQLIDFSFAEHAAFERPVKQLAVSANVVIADHFQPVPCDRVDEIEAEDLSQITFNCEIEG
jgi:hypothetical protein